MKFDSYKFSEITINFDSKRIPLSSKQRSNKQGVYPYYGAQGIIDYVDDFIFDGKFLLIAEDGENLKSRKQKIAQLANGKFWVNNHAHIIQTNEKCILEYLYYMFNILDISGYITGSAQPKLSQSNLNAISINLPSIEAQKKIVSILSILDDKIALNQQINNNLEQQAQAIFKSWLSENSGNYNFIPLYEIALINPDTYSIKENWKHISYLDTSSITNGVISEIQTINPQIDKLPSRAKRKVKNRDIVYSTVRPNQRHFGIITNPSSDMLVSTGFAVIRSMCENVSNELIYLHITNNDFIEKMQQLAEQSTSTFPSIKPSDLGSCLIPCPNNESGIRLNEHLKSVYNIISCNNEQNNELAKLRDTLLPKLMNGEIDVHEIKGKEY